MTMSLFAQQKLIKGDISFRTCLELATTYMSELTPQFGLIKCVSEQQLSQPHLLADHIFL